MTDKVLNHFKSKIDGLTLAPFDDGRFEVSVDGEKVWSKLATGEFPDETALLKAMAKKA